jgi:hypothetical protein
MQVPPDGNQALGLGHDGVNEFHKKNSRVLEGFILKKLAPKGGFPFEKYGIFQL